MLAISLMRMGAKKRPFYRVVVKEKRSKRDGKYIENLGTYNPMAEPAEVSLKHERIQYWMSVGAQPSETVASLIKHNPEKSEEEMAAAKQERLEKAEADKQARLEAKKADAAKRQEERRQAEEAAKREAETAQADEAVEASAEGENADAETGGTAEASAEETPAETVETAENTEPAENAEEKPETAE